MAEDGRPPKRMKFANSAVNDTKYEQGPVSENEVSSASKAAEDVSRVKATPSASIDHSSKRNMKHASKSQSKAKGPSKPRSTSTFSRPSVICAGDRGIYVTSDKGREQKSLLELHDILQEYLEDAGVDASGKPLELEHLTTTEEGDIVNFSSKLQSTGIEADIASELAELKGSGVKEATTTSVLRPMQLITLDIPCVSLLRFPPGSALDPVDIVHTICLHAADPANPQQSRYVKRLTPISNLAKALSQGIEKLCEAVLPVYFAAGEDGHVESKTFAIRPTVRNNDKLGRDEIIELVATSVQEIGDRQHKVDLKLYQRGVLVEIYRGWVSMCVVDNTNTGAYEKGFEELKRFNLAEIYANR